MTAEHTVSRRSLSRLFPCLLQSLRKGLGVVCLMCAYLSIRFYSMDLVGLDHREAALMLDYHVFELPTMDMNAKISAIEVLQSNQRAIFIISMGAQAVNSSLMERFVYSARTLGEYDGWIVALTDASVGRYDKLQAYAFPRKNSTSTNPLHAESRFVVINPDAKYYPTTKFKHRDMVFKRMKTHILDILDEDRRFDDVQLVYYLDVDNLFANPATSMFDELESTYRIGDGTDSSPKIYFFEGDQKKGRGGPLMRFQGGQFILERKHSKACLEKWRYWIDEDPNEARDQIALLKMNQEFKQYGIIEGNRHHLQASGFCEMIAMNKSGSTYDHILFPSKNDIQWAANHHRQTQSEDAQRTIGREHYPTLIHIKNTGNALEKTNDDDMEVYIRNVLNLTDASPEEDVLGITKKIPRIQALASDIETRTKRQ